MEEHKPVGRGETVYLKMDGTPVRSNLPSPCSVIIISPGGLILLRDITDRVRKPSRPCGSRKKKYRALIETTNGFCHPR